MNRSSKILIIVFVLLSLITGYFVINQKKSEDPVFVDPLLKDRDFAVQNMDEIERIAIKRKKYPPLIFSKMEGKWVINDRYKVNEETMPHLLAVLKGVKMKYIPPVNMQKTIIKDIAQNGIEVMLYNGEKEVVKHYFVGSEFGDGSDTPFLMKGSAQPFMMFLPGLDGSVRRRLNYNIGEWKSKIVFEEEVDKIKKIEMNYPQDRTSGFTITKYNDGYKILNADNEVTNRTPNQNTMAAYFDFFSYIRGESNESDNPERKRIVASPVFCKLSIVYTDNTTKSFTFYSMGDLTGDFVTKSPGNVHVDNKFFIEMPDGELLLAQYRVLNKIMKPFWYFF